MNVLYAIFCFFLPSRLVYFRSHNFNKLEIHLNISCDSVCVASKSKMSLCCYCSILQLLHVCTLHILEKQSMKWTQWTGVSVTLVPPNIALVLPKGHTQLLL